MFQDLNLLLFALDILPLVVFALFPAKRKALSRLGECTWTLQDFQICKWAWMLKEDKTTNDIPSWSDLSPFIETFCSGSKTNCAEGGIYTIGRVGEWPKCSLDRYGHTVGKTTPKMPIWGKPNPFASHPSRLSSAGSCAAGEGTGGKVLPGL